MQKQWLQNNNRLYKRWGILSLLLHAWTWNNGLCSMLLVEFCYVIT